MNNAMVFGAAVMLVNSLVVPVILPSRIRSPRDDPCPAEEQERDMRCVVVAAD